MPKPVDPHRPVEKRNPQAPSVSNDADETGTTAMSESGASTFTFGSPVEPGEVGLLGPYRIVKELGRGGMGAVFAALDTRLDRQIALKVMLPQFAAQPVAKERFLREARAAAKITHDNVVTVYEADERGGVPYIAMQFLQGYPLDAYLKTKGNPGISQVLRIAREMAAGLAAAHRIGLVHRDIKPGNLWLEAPDGRVKVLDFGLARPVDAEVELTKSGAIVGTPAYMSPEQARGEKVDHRTDLFSVGAVLYRLCTGRLPFQGPSTMAVLMALGTLEPPPVRELNPAVPESLAALIHQLLAKTADARPQTADEVGRRARAIAEELSAPMATAVAGQPQVVPMPMHVTVLSEANPFADIEVTEAESETAEPTAAPLLPRKKSDGKGLWIGVGLAALLAIVVGGAIIIKNKDRTVTKTEVPNRGAATGKDKGGKTGGKPTADTSPDRKAAEYVLSLGGSVNVSSEGTTVIQAAADLPTGPFTTTAVNLGTNQAVTDAGLAAFKDCKALTFLNLSLTRVTDAGLSHFKNCKGLTYLALDSTKVTDAGLSYFRDCKGLTNLILSSTQVTDTGLAYFEGCKNLMELQLYQTRVTEAGMVYFKDCKNLTILNLNTTVVSDAGLAHFKDCKGLTSLALFDSAVTDAGLAHFKDCKNLTHIAVCGRTVTDAGLANLKDCKALTAVGLSGTQMTDAGLAHFKGCTSLTSLDVHTTKVTAKGVKEFHAVMPGCEIKYDGGTIAPVDVDRKAAEYVLSIGGLVSVNNVRPDIRAVSELPNSRFTLTHVNLNDKAAITDADLAVFKNCKGLIGISLNGTPVTDLGLAVFKDCKGLTYLDVRKTKVMAKGLEEFHAAVPGCKIEHDGGTIEAKRANGTD